ncbi:MAG: hypothetical protein NC412_13500 [Roseburia sp.]|nr:hypothetical protein [Roseburia sp.]MCM1279741.1 hypothetical protein [Robinsoniella sp.]
MAKRYYWLKLKADWLLDKRIKKLCSIADDNTPDKEPRAVFSMSCSEGLTVR